MVLIHLKRSEQNQFLHEAGCATPIEVLAGELVALNNERVRIEKLALAAEGLAEHGPLRPEGVRGLTAPEAYDPAFEQLAPAEKAFLEAPSGLKSESRPDKTGYRTGFAPARDAAQKLLDVCRQARERLAPQRVERRELFGLADAKELLGLFRGAAMIAYPGFHGLPDWEPLCLLLENKLDFPQTFPDSDFVAEKQAALWWAKKELQSGKTLADYVGKNEKTKIVVKIAEKGKGAPVAEPPIDQETHKKMLAFYYKKQEEAKQLEENSEDAYLDSAWSNPANLKNQLVNGGAGIKFRPGMK